MAENVTCERCQLCTLAYLTGYDGLGMYEASVCIENVVTPKVVDRSALRNCESFSTGETPNSEAKTDPAS
jgi:hypothetical protein